jgi:hypothetical protein
MNKIDYKVILIINKKGNLFQLLVQIIFKLLIIKKIKYKLNRNYIKMVIINIKIFFIYLLKN